MSVDINFIIEVQDEEGKWHLVKWFTDKKLERYDTLDDDEIEVTIEGKKYIQKHCMWTGLAWRDECSYGGKYSNISSYGLPNDIGEDTKTEIMKVAEMRKKYYLSLYGGETEYFKEENYTYENYSKQFSFTYMDEMTEVCEEKLKEWKENVKNSILKRDENNILNRLDVIEKLLREGKETKVKKKKNTEDDMLIYLFDEELYDVLALYREKALLKAAVIAFTGNHFINEEKIRIISYIS